jgi:ADP-ribose pyrophosphatase YjhB (NUDIX family)
MEHRIRAAALVVNRKRLLLVKHQNPASGAVFWVPPGGGLKDGESIFDCARRETFEETGLSVKLDRIAYVREFVEVERGRHHLELFILAESWSGALSLRGTAGEEDEDWVQDARFLSKTRVRDLRVFPSELKNQFWADLRDGFPHVRYLGVDRVLRVQ